MSDQNYVACEQEHEMNTVLLHFKRRQTAANRQILQNACRKWKTDDAYKPHNRGSFYNYLQGNKVLEKLENA